MRIGTIVKSIQDERLDYRSSTAGHLGHSSSTTSPWRSDYCLRTDDVDGTMVVFHIQCDNSLKSRSRVSAQWLEHPNPGDTHPNPRGTHWCRLFLSERILGCSGNDLRYLTLGRREIGNLRRVVMRNRLPSPDRIRLNDPRYRSWHDAALCWR